MDDNIEVRPKMLSNVVSAAWTHMDKKWILPAVGIDEGGPIQESGGMVLTVDGNAVELENKKKYNKQLWKKEGTEFRLKNEAGSHYLTAVTTGTLAGKFIYIANYIKELNSLSSSFRVSKNILNLYLV